MAYPSLRFRPSSIFYTTLDATITGATDPILVVDNSNAPDAPGIISIDNEEIYYAVKGVNEFSTLTRGYNNTTATGHDSGRPVACPISTDLFSKLWDAIEYLKTQTDLVIPTSLVTAKGDIIAATASGAVDNVAVGTDGQTLIADAASTAGVKWQDEIHIDTVVSSATPTPTIAGRRNLFTVTALEADAELQNPTGTKANGDTLLIRIKDDGSARALTYDSEYRAIGIDLLATTVASKTHYELFIYNSADSKWDGIAVGSEE